MTKYGLAHKLSNDTGKEWTEDQAQAFIDDFFDVYPEFKDWQIDIEEAYLDGSGISLPCGWRMFNDNPNIRSVCNVPVQGFSASVMRKAVDIAVSRGVRVLFTLHDAIYIEGDIGDETKIKVLRDAMREAFVFYADEKYKKVASKIKLDPFAWGPDCKEDSEIDIEGWKVPCSNIYLDSRAESDYKKFSKYFKDPETELV